MVQTGAGGNDWNDVGLNPDLATHLTGLGYSRPTALQREFLPAVATERDVLIEAPIGTGRTLAIGIAVTELVRECDSGESAVALIVTSSDQRCEAIARSLQSCGRSITRAGQSGVRTATLTDIGTPPAQADALAQPLDVIVGTPGRISSMASAEQLSIDSLEMVLVDDADDIVVSEQANALAEVLDCVEVDRQRVVLAGALLPPLSDVVDGRLTDPERPQLPSAEPLRNTVPQQAFGLGNPTPAKVAALANALGSPVMALVHDSEIAEFQKFVAQNATPVEVRPMSDPGPLTEGSAVVCTRLPTWTDHYTSLLQAASTANCSEVVLLSTPANRQLLRALGKAGGARLNAAPFPTESAVGVRQDMKLEDLVADQLSKVSSQPAPRFLASVHRLSAEYDVADIAAAAMQLAHQALQREIEPGQDIPLLLRQNSTARQPDRRQATNAPDKSAQRRKGGDRRGKETEPGMTRLFVAAGYNYGVRPGDIVGAFAGESGLSGKEIGNIDIRESFTLVEVPEQVADDVIDAMANGTIKGRDIEVRRERY